MPARKMSQPTKKKVAARRAMPQPIRKTVAKKKTAARKATMPTSGRTSTRRSAY